MSKKWRIALILLPTMMVSVLISACQSKTVANSSSLIATATTTSNTSSNPGAFDCVSGNIIASGSTTLQPYVEAVAASYTAKCPSARITVQPDDSRVGLRDVQFDVSQIGSSDVSALDTQTELIDHQVAIAIFTVIVNSGVHISTIKSGDLAAIYTGKISNWSQLGGADIPITVVSRPITSGTRENFKHFVLDNQEENPGHTRNLTVASTGTLIQTVAQTRGAIGYASLGSAINAGSRISIVKIDNKEPSLNNVRTNSYKFWAIEHMYTKGQPGGLVQAFLNYMLSNDALAIGKKLSFFKITDVPKNIIGIHK
jgi:phosphate transport system substrate-binding protein